MFKTWKQMLTRSRIVCDLNLWSHYCYVFSNSLVFLVSSDGWRQDGTVTGLNLALICRKHTKTYISSMVTLFWIGMSCRGVGCCLLNEGEWGHSVWCVVKEEWLSLLSMAHMIVKMLINCILSNTIMQYFVPHTLLWTSV